MSNQVKIPEYFTRLSESIDPEVLFVWRVTAGGTYSDWICLLRGNTLIHRRFHSDNVTYSDREMPLNTVGAMQVITKVRRVYNRIADTKIVNRSYPIFIVESKDPERNYE